MRFTMISLCCVTPKLFCVARATSLGIDFGLFLPVFRESVPKNVQSKHDFIIDALEETSRPGDGSCCTWSEHIGVQLCTKKRPSFLDDDPSELATLEWCPDPFYILDTVGDDDVADVPHLCEVRAKLAERDVEEARKCADASDQFMVVCRGPAWSSVRHFDLE